MIDKTKGITIMTADYPITINLAQLEGRNKTDGYTMSLQSNLCINNLVGI